MPQLEYAILKQIYPNEWVLLAPKGHRLADRVFRGNKTQALEWGRSFVSSWYNITVRLEENDEKKSRVSEPPI